VIARIINIFGLNLIFKSCMKKWRIRYKDLSIVAVGGTIRGSVAFALILTIEANQANKDQVSVIKSTTLGLVCFTTIVLGGLMPKIIKCILGDEMGKNTNADTVIVPEDDEEVTPASHLIP
jgi:NhaP-type Na+/H+ or K+/H+ antiporter